MKPLRNRPNKQTGAVLILIFLAMFLAVGTATIKQFGSLESSRLFNSPTHNNLVKIKGALINHAVANAIKPGLLPCPDTDNDGLENRIGGNCVSLRGWLPFRTLSLNDTRDTAGERFWYAVAADFAQSPAVLNSETVADLAVDGTPGFIAVIIAPRSNLTGQNLRAPHDFLPNGNIDNIGSYLELVNADGDLFTYTNAISTDTFNDTLVTIGRRELMPLVEQRVAREFINLVDAYVNNALCPEPLPVPASFSPNSATHNSVAGLTSGLFPSTDIVWAGCAGAINIPLWLTANNWDDITYYAVSPEGLACSAQCLTVNGWQPPGGHRAAIIVSGTATPAQIARPSTNLSDYYEGANSVVDLLYEYVEPLDDYTNQNDVIEVY